MIQITCMVLDAATSQFHTAITLTISSMVICITLMVITAMTTALSQWQTSLRETLLRVALQAIVTATVSNLFSAGQLVMSVQRQSSLGWLTEACRTDRCIAPAGCRKSVHGSHQHKAVLDVTLGTASEPKDQPLLLKRWYQNVQY